MEEAAGCQETRGGRKTCEKQRREDRSSDFLFFFPSLPPPLVSEEAVEGREAGERGLQRVSDWEERASQPPPSTRQEKKKPLDGKCFDEWATPQLRRRLRAAGGGGETNSTDPKKHQFAASGHIAVLPGPRPALGSLRATLCRLANLSKHAASSGAESLMVHNCKIRLLLTKYDESRRSGK